MSVSSELSPNAITSSKHAYRQGYNLGLGLGLAILSDHIFTISQFPCNFHNASEIEYEHLC